VAGTYTSLWVITPRTRKAGDIVDVQAVIQNIHGYILVVDARGAVDGTPLNFGVGLILNPGEVGVSYASFYMPARDVIVSVGSWVGQLLDDSAEVPITLEEVAPPPPPYYTGKIIRKELEYDHVQSSIPVY